MSRMVKCFLFLATLLSTACATTFVSLPKGTSFQQSLYLTETRGNGKNLALAGTGQLHQDHHVPILRTGAASAPTPTEATGIWPRTAPGTVSATVPLSTYFSDYIQPMTTASTTMDSLSFVAPLHTATGPFVLHPVALGSFQPRIFQPSATGSMQPSASKRSPTGSFQPDLVPPAAVGSGQSPINQPDSIQSTTPTSVGLFQPFTMANTFQPVAPTSFSGSLLQALGYTVWPWNIPQPAVTGATLPQQSVTENIGQLLLTSLNPHIGRLYMPPEDYQFQQLIKMDPLQLEYPYPLLKPMNSVQTVQKSTNTLKEQTSSGPNLPTTTVDPLQPKTTSDSRLINDTASPPQNTLVTKFLRSTNDPYRPQIQPVPTLTQTGATAFVLSSPDHLSVADPFQQIPDHSLSNTLQTQPQLGQSQQVTLKDRVHAKQRSDLWPTVSSTHPTRPQTTFDHEMPLPTGAQIQPANPSHHGSTTINEIQLQRVKTASQLSSVNVKGTDKTQTTTDVGAQRKPVDPLYPQIKSSSLPPISQALILSDPLLSHNALNLGHPAKQGETITPPGMSDSNPTSTTVDKLISRVEPLPQFHIKPAVPLTKISLQGASGQHMSSKKSQSLILSDSAKTLTKRQFQPQNLGTSILDASLPNAPSSSGSMTSLAALDRLQQQDPSDPMLNVNMYQPRNTVPSQNVNYVDPKLPVRL